MLKPKAMDPLFHKGGGGKNNITPVQVHQQIQHLHRPLGGGAMINHVLLLLGIASFGLMIIQYWLIGLNDSYAKNVNRVEDFLIGEVPFTSAKNATSNKNDIKSIKEKQRDSKSHQSTLNSSPPYYVVFSTSCTDQQNWESWVFFYHCYRVKQPGNITRIVSGCSAEKETELRRFHTNYVIPTMGSNYHIHFTPDFSRVELDKNSPYKYMNKPYGLRDWFWNGPFNLREKYEDPKNIDDDDEILDGIVFLLDPDMILLRPLRHDFTNEEVLFIQSEKDLPTKVVKHGYPIAQQDGYLNNDWIYAVNYTYVFSNWSGGVGPVVPIPEGKYGPIHWNTGPPYIATVKDMYRISILWSELAPRVLKVHPHLFSEMYGYIIATVQLQLPHTLIKSLVISTTQSTSREGWSYIDALPDTNELCTIANTAATTHNISDGIERTKLPIGLHYCKRYLLRRNFFSKYRVKKNIMRCDKSLLHSIATLDGIYPSDSYYPITPPRADRKDLETWKEIPGQPFTKKIAKREAFMLCSLTAAVNEALRFLKLNTSACENQLINLNETYNVYDDPTDY